MPQLALPLGGGQAKRKLSTFGVFGRLPPSALPEASGVQAEEGPDAEEVPGLLARVRRVLQHPREPHRQDHLLRRSEQCGLEVLKSAY